MDWTLWMEVLTATGWETWIVNSGLTLDQCLEFGQDWLIPGNDNVKAICREEGGT